MPRGDTPKAGRRRARRVVSTAVAASAATPAARSETIRDPYFTLSAIFQMGLNMDQIFGSRPPNTSSGAASRPSGNRNNSSQIRTMPSTSAREDRGRSAAGTKTRIASVSTGWGHFDCKILLAGPHRPADGLPNSPDASLDLEIPLQGNYRAMIADDLHAGQRKFSGRPETGTPTTRRWAAPWFRRRRASRSRQRRDRASRRSPAPPGTLARRPTGP